MLKADDFDRAVAAMRALAAEIGGTVSGDDYFCSDRPAYRLVHLQHDSVIPETCARLAALCIKHGLSMTLSGWSSHVSMNACRLLTEEERAVEPTDKPIVNQSSHFTSRKVA